MKSFALIIDEEIECTISFPILATDNNLRAVDGVLAENSCEMNSILLFVDWVKLNSTTKYAIKLYNIVNSIVYIYIYSYIVM